MLKKFKDRFNYYLYYKLFAMTEFSRQFYSELVDHISDGVYFVDYKKKICFWNKTAEQITGFTAEEVEGKLCSDHIMMHVNTKGESVCNNGCPLEHSISHQEASESDLYLLHKDGHRVPVHVQVKPVLDNDQQVIGAVEIFSDKSNTLAMQQRMKDLKKMALLDPLTKIANRRYIRRVMKSRLEEVRRYGWTIGVLFVDIDDFKRINDTWGHPVGDAVLEMVARTLKYNMRPFDVAGRWGGDEFIAVIYNTDNKHLQSISKRLRALVQGSSVSADDRKIQVTISVGGTLARGDDTIKSILGRIDSLLYNSKEHGKGRATIN
ncbi:diguanylate cyclase [Planctomycetota bacterium]